jgi:tetratricopeptide (TPR) repeat protein
MPTPIHEARRTLGIGAEKITRSRITELRRSREALARRLQATTNRKRLKNLKKELDAFDTSLSLVIAEMEAIEARRSRSSTAAILMLTLCLLVIAAGTLGWMRFRDIQDHALRRDAHIRDLETLGWLHVDNRRWKEADAAFSEITSLLPGSELSRIGHGAAAAGRKEEETQFIAYWTGQALAELEAGRLDEAATAARRVIESHPDEKEANLLALRIEHARVEQKILSHVAEVRSLIETRDWKSSAQRAEELVALYPARQDISDIAMEARTGWEKLQQDQAKAETLYQHALANNTGEFNQEILDRLREAATLSPDREDISNLLEKMSSYTRTLRVPEDHATPDEALAHARDNDRILLGKGTWRGPLIVKHSIDLQGSGPEETILTSSAADGNAITIQAASVRISGITFRHDSLLIEHGDRFSAATITGGRTEFVNCRFTDSNGHGLAVIQGASAIIRRCLFRDNAWNGVAAIGKGSTIAMEESEATGNFHNGVETWDGASASLTQNRITANSRNGIHADQSDTPITCRDNLITDNREFGITLTSATNGAIHRNKSRNNLLGGILVRTRAASVSIEENESTGNIGPDIVLESGIPTDAYVRNTVTRDRPGALHSGAKIDP